MQGPEKILAGAGILCYDKEKFRLVEKIIGFQQEGSVEWEHI